MNRTRAVLLDGAVQAFAQHGLQGSTMQSVAAAAGVAKGTLYNYFRTKDDVVRALLSAELDRLAALAGGRPLDQALTALADELGTHPVLRRLVESEPEHLTALLLAGPERWTELVAWLTAVLAVDADGAELAGRWLLGVVLQPGLTTQRRRQAAVLAGVLHPAVLSPGADGG